MPNIIMIMTDQFRADCIRFDGNTQIYTPYLDELAADSCYFKRGYATSPTCVPARACLVTGQKPSNTGFFSNNFTVDWNYKDTLMEVLKKNGHQTINVGKNHFKPQRAGLGFEVNRIYETKNSEDGIYSDYHQWLFDKCGNYELDHAKQFENNGFPVMVWTHDPDLHPNSWTVTESIKQLQNRDRTRPFYLQLSFHRPHPPLDPPKHVFDMYQYADLDEPPIGDWAKSYSETSHTTNPFEGFIDRDYLKEAKKAYYAQITHIDNQIGRLMYYLKSNQLYQDTMIVFISDHGELLGDHNMFRKGPLLEGSVRIPFIVKFPKSYQNQWNHTVTDTPVSLIDLFPTFINAAGYSCDKKVDGQDIVKLLDKSETRPYIFCENYRNNPAVKTGGICVVGQRYKYIWNSFTGTELFFDLKEDPKELKNLIQVEELYPRIQEMKSVVIEEYKSRPYDQMVRADGTLEVGKVLPSYRAPQETVSI